MTKRQDCSDAKKVREAEAARTALASALRAAGIQLPAMDVVPVAGGRYGLVELGQCAAPVAHALAAVVAKGARS
ncbi:hypothetical protein [Streptomyces sp. DW26H14]|uniref:hypothetical protein n=1 Tax=Streptomyces sp. DW26H14 TaxID=3435395 RepID=UPI00403DF472